MPIVVMNDDEYTFSAKRNKMEDLPTTAFWCFVIVIVVIVVIVVVIVVVIFVAVIMPCNMLHWV